ncbi:MAG: N,N-dimethylformamidase beta subunit family domain-containing protein [Acidimicrobiales bacterium]
MGNTGSPMGTSLSGIGNTRHRTLRCLVAAVATLGGLLVIQPTAQAATPCEISAVSIACENSKAGTAKNIWDVTGTGSANILGFANEMSYAPGEVVDFRIKTDSDNYRLDIYRMGFYAGKGARSKGTIEPSATLPQIQPTCNSDVATGLVDCGNWDVSASWNIPADAVSGIYFAKLVREDPTAGNNHIAFVVRNDTSKSDLLFQTSDTTWQAYNEFGGNSLYKASNNQNNQVGKTRSPQNTDGRAYKVSYNRPFTVRSTSPQDWVFNAEYPMVRWLEEHGYDVSYTSGIDTARRGSELLEHKVFLSVGHDEYWSGPQRSNVEAARDAGVNLAFFSGNSVYWKTRWENSTYPSATPYRTLVSYKESKANANIDPNSAWTGTWRDDRLNPPDAGRPENELMGTLFVANGSESRSITVPQADGLMRLWRNTSVATLGAGTVATLPEGTLGYEWDEDADNGFRPAGLVKMSDTTVTIPGRLQDECCTFAAGPATHRITLYRHTSGALVFGAGTVQWSWGLDANHDRSGTAPDERMQQATVNLLADMGVQPAKLNAPYLTPATASSDTVAPSTAITSPAGGATLPVNTPVTMSGTATDSGGGRVGGVEVSTDNGATWHPAFGRENWTYTWTPTSSSTANLKARSVDDSANLGAAVSPTTTPPTTTPPTTTPPPPPPTPAPQATPPAPTPPPTVVFASADPLGSFDVASTVPGGLRVAGWALDPDVTTPVSLHVYVGGAFAAALSADANRPDVGAAFPGFGNAHGFDTVFGVDAGTHSACVYGINQGPGTNVLIGCRTVTVTTNPFGSFDVASMAPGGTRVAGWALDPSTTNSIGIHMYVDNVFAGAFDANANRPDIASVFPGYGEAHGFDAVIAIPSGFHTVCGYGINQGPGANVLIGCRWVMVNNDPFGSLDIVSMTSSGLRVAGWALDPDIASSISLHVYVDGGFAGVFNADESRLDIGGAFPGFGNAHGFDSVFSVSPGTHNVCVYGINQGSGANSLIGCRAS